MAFRCSIPVRFGDVDVAKILYYPRYLHFCHIAMEELFEAVTGIRYDRIVLEEGVGYPTVRSEVEYRKPVPMGETLELTVSVARLGRKSVDFRYEGRRKSDGALAFVARTRGVAVDMGDWHSVEMPDHHRKGLATLVEDPEAGPAGPARTA